MHVFDIIAIQMGRPSKHKAHTNALLRQKDWKVPKVDKEQSSTPKDGRRSLNRSSSVSARLERVSECLASDSAEIDNGGMDLSPDEGYTELSPVPPPPFNRRCTSIGSVNTVSDAVSLDSDSNSSVDGKNDSCRFSHASAAASCKQRSSAKTLPPQKTTLSVSVSDPSDLNLIADTKDVLSPEEVNRTRVWSGGYCCEVKNSPQNEKTAAANSQDVIGGDWLNLRKLMKEEEDCLNSSYCSNGNPSNYSESLLAPTAELTSQQCCFPANRSNGLPSAASRGSSQYVNVSPPAMPISREPSPGVRWHTNNDRDSPYISVMALASSCQLFSEACRSPTLEGVVPDVMEETIASSDCTVVTNDKKLVGYWMQSDLPDENILFTEKHCELINRITAAYDRFVQTGTTINQTLTNELTVNQTS